MRKDVEKTYFWNIDFSKFSHFSKSLILFSNSNFAFFGSMPARKGAKCARSGKLTHRKHGKMIYACLVLIILTPHRFRTLAGAPPECTEAKCKFFFMECRVEGISYLKNHSRQSLGPPLPH